jgi:uncharacterized protein (TIRG00374 family)
MRKRIFDVSRIIVCVAALLIVLRGVTIRDRVALRDSQIVVGRAEVRGESVIVSSRNAAPRAIPISEVAVDEHGDLTIQYGLASAIHDSNKTLLLLAVLIHAPVGFIQALRLQWLLRVQEIHLGYWRCAKLSFAGNFLNFATPLGSNAGDVFKAYFVTTHTTRKTEAATTIVLDRVIGLGTLLLCVALITILAHEDPRLAVVRPFVLTALLVGSVCAAVYFSPFVRRRTDLARLGERWSMFAHAERIDHAIRTLAGRTWTVLGAVLATVALQVLAVGAYFVVAIALQLDAGLHNLLEYFAYFYTGAVIQSLPGPPQGLGTVELAYRYFLDPYGSPAQILCLALVARAVVLVCAAPGLWVTITGGYRPSQAATGSKGLESDRHIAPGGSFGHVR